MSVILLGATCLACGPAPLRSEDYDRSCAQNSDCVVTTLGDACSCNLTYDAINRGALDDVTADRATARTSCPPWSDAIAADCLYEPPPGRPVCSDDVCTIPDDPEPCPPANGASDACRGVDP